MHFYGITVVIICKCFEVVKSNTIILMIRCDNHLHTKNKIFFWISSFLAKTKGGGRSPSAKKTHFFGPTEISGRLCGRRSQNLAGWKIIVALAGIFKDFSFESKTKKLCHFKVSQFEIFEKQGCPPLWNECWRKPEHLHPAWCRWFTQKNCRLFSHIRSKIHFTRAFC